MQAFKKNKNSNSFRILFCEAIGRNNTQQMNDETKPEEEEENATRAHWPRTAAKFTEEYIEKSDPRFGFSSCFVCACGVGVPYVQRPRGGNRLAVCECECVPEKTAPTTCWWCGRVVDAFGLIKVTYIFYLVNWTDVIPSSQPAEHNRKMINIMCQVDLHVVVIVAEQRFESILLYSFGFSFHFDARLWTRCWRRGRARNGVFSLSSISVTIFQFKFEPPLENHWLFGGQLCVNNGIES